jgi:hypothetical protein
LNILKKICRLILELFANLDAKRSRNGSKNQKMSFINVLHTAQPFSFWLWLTFVKKRSKSKYNVHNTVLYSFHRAGIIILKTGGEKAFRRLYKPEPVFVNLSRSPGIDSQRAGTLTLLVLPARQATWAGGIDSSESIPGLHNRLQIRPLLILSTFQL